MIISDSTTLIILFDLNRVELLTNLFPKVIIPQAVYAEITYKKSIKKMGFLSVKQPQNSETLEALKMMLDLGESEAIALALEMNLQLIIDEKKGRKIAMNQGIRIIGLLGIVYLNVIKEFLDISQAEHFIADAVQHGYRINQKLLDDMFLQLKQQS
jgi:predicted nucleic acid-binding protein